MAAKISRKGSASKKASVAASLDVSPPRGRDVALREMLPIIDESLEVSKLEKDKGGYRITRRVDTREVIVDELLRSHRIEIERCPMGKQLEGVDIPEPRYEGDTLIVPVVEEVLVTQKRLLLVEEIRITRIHGTHRKPQKVTLRKEDVSIERLAAEPPSAGKPS